VVDYSWKSLKPSVQYQTLTGTDSESRYSRSK